MKTRAAVIAVVMTVLAFTGRSQEKIKLDLGVMAGVNFAQLDGKTWNNGYKTNLLGGLFAGIHGGRAGIEIQPVFSQSAYVTGSDFHNIYSQYYNNAVDSVKQGTFRVSYLNIPVLFKLKVLNLLWLQVGPQYSGIVSTKDVDHLVKDSKQLFKSGQLSGIGGLEVHLPFHLRVGARYVFGLTDLNGTSISDTWKEKQIQVTVGYNFL